MQRERDGYVLTDDPLRLDARATHAYLTRSYWAEGITLERVERSMRSSLCLGVLHAGRQVAFCRVISDHATFAYLCDVYVLEEHRGAGLARWMLACMHEHPRLSDLRRWMLVTRDAHGLYERLGWKRAEHPENVMEIVKRRAYSSSAES